MAETQSYQRNQFNTTEGGIFMGHVMKTNAKMAVALRALNPSNFVKGHYIALQMTGKMRGSILNSAPAVYEIFCGEKPVNGKAGVWLAQSGDIDIRAPQGKITLSANNIEIISSGSGNKTGHILLGADGKIHGFSDDIKWQAGDSIALQGDGSISQITTGKVETVGGSVVSREAEGVDVGSPGGGAETALEWADTMARTLKSLLGG